MYKAKAGNSEFEISFDGDRVRVNDKPLDWDISKLGEQKFHIISDHKSYSVEILERENNNIRIRVNDQIFDVETWDKMDLLLEKLGMQKALEDVLNDVRAPMPGLILKVAVEEGQEVSKGDSLMILEAMKMENVLKAPGDGTVKAIKVRQGDTVEKNQVLIQF